MSGRTWIAAVAAVAVVAVLGGRALAGDANSEFDSLFGADVKRVLATPDPKDNIELAGQLLSAAKKTPNMDLLTILCEKTHDLAAKSAGGAGVATEALELLTEKVPQKRCACRDKLLSLYQGLLASKSGDERLRIGEAMVDLYLDAADEKAQAGEWPSAIEQARKAFSMAENVRSPTKENVRQRLLELAARERLEKQAGDLKTRLKADANNRTIREQLIRLLLVDMDSPAEAAKFVDSSLGDQTLRANVPLAAQPVAGLAEQACMDLGDWYRALGEKAAGDAKIDMYERAKGYFQAYLAKHAAEDLSRTKALVALESLTALLFTLNTSESKGWLDALRVVDVSKNVWGGTWVRKDQKLLVTAGGGSTPALAIIPAAPDGSYSFLAQFVRRDGNGPVCLHLPVGSTSCALMLSGRAVTYEMSSMREILATGLNRVDDKPWYNNTTTVRPPPLENGKEYVLEARVLLRGKTASISVDLNGQQCLRWEGPEAMLRNGHGWLRSLGVGASSASVTFQAARLRVLSGGVQSPWARRPREPFRPM